MVRTSISIIVFLFCISCNREGKEEYNYSDSYVNYPDSTIYPFDMDSLFVTIKPNNLSVADFIVNSEKKPLNDKLVHYVESKNYARMEIDSSRIKYKYLNYYPCGKLNLRYGVTAYLVLSKDPNEMSRSDWFYNLIILNIKKNCLKSMIIASNNGLNYPETIMQTTYINQADNRFLIINIAADGIDNNTHYVDDFWSRIGILKPIRLRYYYVSFTLDENGFVKLIPLDEDKFPAYLK